MSTDDLIARGKDLIDGITDEAWVTVADEGDPFDVPIAADGKYISRCPDCGVRGGFSAPDAEFIAAARTLVPELVDRLEFMEHEFEAERDRCSEHFEARMKAEAKVRELVAEAEKLRGAIESISDIAIGIGRPFHRILDDILAVTNGIEAK